jgi:hypothetical protein
MSIQFNIMYPVFKIFKTKILLYNSLRTYDIFIVNIDQPFMSIQFNIMYPVFKIFKTKILLYNSLRTYDIFIVNIDQPFISFNNILFFWLSKNPSGR